MLTAALARELSHELEGSRVRAFLLDGDARRVLLFARQWTLILELHPRDGWMTLLDAGDPPAEARPLASRLVQVRALPDDSVLSLGLQRVRGRDEGVELMVEWVGNRWNAVVVGHRSRVIRHVLVPRPDGPRALAAGAPYDPPPTTGRAGVDDDLSEAEWNRILADAGNDAEARRRALLRSVAYTSSLNVERFLKEDGFRAWQRAQDPDNWGAHLLETDRGLQPYPVDLSLFTLRHADDLLGALAAAREDGADHPPHTLLLPPGLLERAEVRRRRAEGRLRGLGRELDRARDPEPIREIGDLILARFGEIPRGKPTVTLRDFAGGEVEVELDPTLPPQENARRYYDEAARMERAGQELPKRIQEARRELHRWTEIVSGLMEGTADPEEVARRLGPERKSRGAGKERGPSLPYRSYRSSGGLEIRVGRGAQRNDDLTFRHSSPEDIWLHARQAPGAHVILRWSDSGGPPRRDLLEAATLAAVHSEARHSGSVPVDWTRRKYVRKPRKAPPGAVVPDQVETIFVEPDPELPGKLGERG